MLFPRLFGHLADGTPVHAWKLANANGLSLQVIEYGGIVTHLRVPDRDGRFANIVLGFDSLEPYLDNRAYFGAIIGRVAGRVPPGRFSFPVAINNPPNHLHGGPVGFDKKLWAAQPVAGGLRLTLRSEDGDQGYPGRVDVAVTIRLTDRNEFVFETEASADRATPFSLTHHSYFNLAGEGIVTDHEIQIFADDFSPVDGSMTPTGRREPVCELRQPTRLADVLPRLFEAHGDLYFLRRDGQPVARVTDPKSGRVLEVRTDEDCLQFYTGVGLETPHQGFCLECQGYPGAVILQPGQPSRHVTTYAFSL